MNRSKENSLASDATSTLPRTCDICEDTVTVNKPVDQGTPPDGETTRGTCKHYLCERCIQDLLLIEPEGKTKNQSNCPLCRVNDT